MHIVETEITLHPSQFATLEDAFNQLERLTKPLTSTWTYLRMHPENTEDFHGFIRSLIHLLTCLNTSIQQAKDGIQLLDPPRAAALRVFLLWLPEVMTFCNRKNLYQQTAMISHCLFSAKEGELSIADFLEKHLAIIWLKPSQEKKAKIDFDAKPFYCRAFLARAQTCYAESQLHLKQLEQAKQTLVRVNALLASDYTPSDLPSDSTLLASVNEHRKSLRTAYLLNKKAWRNTPETLKKLSDELVDQDVRADYYRILAETLLLEEEMNCPLIECYLRTSYSLMMRLYVDENQLMIISPNKLLALYHKLLNHYQQANLDYNVMATCNTLLTILDPWVRTLTQSNLMAQRSPLVLTGVCSQRESVILLKIARSLQEQYQTLLSEYAQKVFRKTTEALEHLNQEELNGAHIRLDHQACQIGIHYDNPHLQKIHLHRLRSLNLDVETNASNNVTTILNALHISVSNLVRSLKTASQTLQGKRLEIQRRLERSQQSVETLERTADPQATQKAFFADRAYTAQILHSQTKHERKPVKRKVPPQKDETTTQPQSQLAKAHTPPIQWAEHLPIFQANDGNVYPIPAHDVHSTQLPKGIFYAYIDRNALYELDDDLLDQFEITLSRAKIVQKHNAHGVRLIRGEVDEDSDYFMKINLHGVDVRLFGRIIASTSVNQEEKILIVFDQALTHSQSLQETPPVTNPRI